MQSEAIERTSVLVSRAEVCGKRGVSTRVKQGGMQTTRRGTDSLVAERDGGGGAGHQVSQRALEMKLDETGRGLTAAGSEG